MTQEKRDIPLTRTERAALALGKFANERPLPKRLQHRFLHTSIAWIQHSIGRRVYCEGMDRFWNLNPDRGVLVCANHRSFFDLHTAMLALFYPGESWAKGIFFPVRSNFFYETPVGVFINFVIGGGAMYPPIFREPAKAPLNQVAVDTVIDLLKRPGTVVGMHPEGTRNKGEDPYTMLPAQPGVGQMILAARPVVVPLFVNGLPNSFVRTVTDSYKKDVRRTNPITLIFGEPWDYSEFTQSKPRAALYKRVADKVSERILELGIRERELRAELARGDHDGGRGWMFARPRAAGYW